MRQDQNSKKSEKQSSLIGVWIAIGTGIGTALGVALVPEKSNSGIFWQDIFGICDL